MLIRSQLATCKTQLSQLRIQE